MTIVLKRRPGYGQQCPIITIIEKLDAEDAKTVETAINDLDWSVNALVQQLRSNGIKISKDSLYAHRKKLCLCESKEQGKK